MSLTTRPFWGFSKSRSSGSLPSLWEQLEDQMEDLAGDTRGVHVWEDDQNLVVEVPVPGVEAKNINVTFNKGVLWISAEQREEDNEKQKNRHYYVSSKRSYSCRIALPTQVDERQESSSELRNGMLVITFKKEAQAQAKKIAVKSKN